MENIEIRKLEKSEIAEVVEIWYETSLQAHSFIPKEYWAKNKISMKNKYIPMSETYIATKKQTILGFISLLDEYLAAIFVKPEAQGKGIGKSLLDHAKNQRQTLQLKVFCKNKKSIAFYQNNGFSAISGSIDENTGEKELLMSWQK